MRSSGVETIAAVLDAYSKGEIELEKPAQGHGQQTYSLPGGKLYSRATVARFLGWVQPSDGGPSSSRGCKDLHARHRRALPWLGDR